MSTDKGKGKTMKINLKTKYENDQGANHLLTLVRLAGKGFYQGADTNQTVHIRKFLLHLYNSANPVDLVAILCCLDEDLTESAIEVMRMRAFKSGCYPQHYFKDGDDLFDALWCIDNPEKLSEEG